MSSYSKSCILRQVENLCRQKRLRLTPMRRQVLQLILTNKAPSKAYDLLEKIGHGVKPPTVYRALDFLLTNGLVHKINSQNAYLACAHPVSEYRHDCYFLICADCGATSECCNPALADLIRQTARKRGFRPTRVVLEIAGRCRACR